MSDVAGAARVGFFDAAKGVAILAVIGGHLAIRVANPYAWPGSGRAIAITFMFHLSTFFLVSGYFLHEDRPFAWKKEARSLVIPYVIGAALSVAAIVASFVLQGGDPSLVLPVMRDWGAAAVYASGDLTGKELIPLVARIGAIWFLLGLFWARCVVTYVCRAPRRVQPFIIVACFLLGLFSVKSLFLPWSIQAGLCASLYVYVGVVARRHDLFAKAKIHPTVWLFAAAAYVWSVLSFSGFGMAVCGYGANAIGIVRNSLGSFGGAFLCIGAMAAFERSRFLNRGSVLVSSCWRRLLSLGRMTLPVLIVHLIEDNALPWGIILDAFSTVPHARWLWPVLLVLRCAFDILVARLLLSVPLLGSAISGGSGRKKRVRS